MTLRFRLSCLMLDVADLLVRLGIELCEFAKRIRKEAR